MAKLLGAKFLRKMKGFYHGPLASRIVFLKLANVMWFGNQSRRKP